MSFRKKVTIAIPCYNEEKFILSTIIKIAGLGCQVLIADNASTDRTPHICQALAEENKNITFVRRPEGATAELASFEQCVFLPNTPYIALLRARDFVSDNYLSALTAALDAHPDAGLACCPIYNLSSRGVVYHQDGLKDPKKLMDDNPFERAVGFFESLYFTPYWSVHRGSYLRDWFSFSMKDDNYVGADLVAMLYSVMHSKWVYVADADYIKRDKFTVEESMQTSNIYLESYIKRAGLSENESKYPHNRLGHKFLSLLRAHPGADDVEKEIYVEKFKKIFRQRCIDDKLPSPF